NNHEKHNGEVGGEGMAETVTILIQGIDRASQAFDKVAAAAQRMERTVNGVSSSAGRISQSLSNTGATGQRALESMGKSAEKAGRMIGRAMTNVANRIRLI